MPSATHRQTTPVLVAPALPCFERPFAGRRFTRLGIGRLMLPCVTMPGRDRGGCISGAIESPAMAWADTSRRGWRLCTAIA